MSTEPIEYEDRVLLTAAKTITYKQEVFLSVTTSHMDKPYDRPDDGLDSSYCSIEWGISSTAVPSAIVRSKTPVIQANQYISASLPFLFYFCRHSSSNTSIPSWTLINFALFMID